MLESFVQRCAAIGSVKHAHHSVLYFYQRCIEFCLDLGPCLCNTQRQVVDLQLEERSVRREQSDEQFVAQKICAACAKGLIRRLEIACLTAVCLWN